MPDLFELIYKNRERHMENVRWSLLTWMFNLNKTFVDDLKNLPYNMTTVVLTIQYLLQVSDFSKIKF